ncbi:MAG: hypothetical protein KDD33_03380 [Bdellovibrionales bacterium]|nr:hypothetical protein [Bdellovibrionales bacterium]
MKHVRLLSAFVMLATLIPSTSWATKARLSALQGARFLTDSQLVFQNPGQIMRLGNYVTYEFGGTSTTSSPKSEGGIYNGMYGGQVGIYLGHMSADQAIFRTANGFLLEENPVELFYGRDNWAVSLGYSSSDKKTTAEKQQSIVLRYGIDADEWEAWVNAEIIQKADKNNDEYKGAPIITAGGEKHLDGDLYVNGLIKYGTVKNTISGTSTDTDVLGGEIGILNRSIKTDKASIYYGPKFRYAEADVSGKKVSSYDLPFYIGMTYQALSWLEARASVSQNLIIGQSKDETQTPAPANESDTIGNNTTVATGIGIQLDKFQLDATFAGSTTGQFNGTAILANLAIVYGF